ncbi:DUF4432 family protein [Youxingia wuxianensis]|uniref:DUF4432 family protein n=1 Tax=Youxingia wuxianensis TaxID=2763678 RepID=A0A926EP60_9FIRM|nr:DUF4432 family protein [Youxingia wuxianensis]MBC8584137.1 DUF4432 family protein [Youxingia wuxianensis]
MSFTRINLKPSFFSERPHTLLSHGPFTATAFLYTTGICGLKITNEKGSMTLLPYQGQQVWRADFCGQEMTMKSIFDEPQDTPDYEHTYGGLLLHCGLTAMGNPAEEDDHPPHGELPVIPYEKAYVGVGCDENGEYIAVGGEYRYRNGLERHYAYEPEVRLYSNSTVADVTAKISNLRSEEMDYMYMCHINWLPVEGARLVYSAPKDDEHFVVFKEDEFDISPERKKAIDDFSDKLAADRSVGDVLDRKAQCYDPELCCSLKYLADENGYAHSMMIAPDGSARYVSFRVNELPYGHRWIARTGDEDACGFCLPCTGNHLGYTYAKNHGMLRYVAPYSSITMKMKFGYLPKEDAEKVETKINQLLK